MSDRRVMTVAAFQGRQCIAYEVLALGETMNNERLYRFLDLTLRPRLEYARVHNPIIMMDNARVHNTNLIRDLLRRLNWEMGFAAIFSRHEPPDMDGFSRIKNKLRGNKHHSVAALVHNYEQAIEDISFNMEFIVSRYWLIDGRKSSESTVIMSYAKSFFSKMCLLLKY